ncbi:glycoside hydrolase family 53 protein [Streptomyces boninensis]|uniref:glycoside hydrolase family 53 protein n=1 Tax=Streptomyces boninensis TaxID=2039455 RepID=UPI003B223FBA
MPKHAFSRPRRRTILAAALGGTAAAAIPLSLSAQSAGAAPLRIRGGDLSTLPKNEDHGATYTAADGTRGDAIKILADAGMNCVRLKVWVNPADGYNDKKHVLAMAKRAKQLGQQLLIDFHYSDSWADPGKQNKPAAWASHGYDRLLTDVYDHTHDVLSALAAQGTTADYVQVGNELNSGMLWPEGSYENWAQLAGLLKSGFKAVQDVSKSTKRVLHIANAADNGTTRWFYDAAVDHDVPFDVVALSYYGYWHGTFADFRSNLKDTAARYGKPILVVETAYPFTLDDADGFPNNIAAADDLMDGYPATSEGQQKYFSDVVAAVAAVPDGRGLGVVYWEPAWTAVDGSGWDPTDPKAGNAWDNQALFNWEGKLLPAARVYSE